MSEPLRGVIVSHSAVAQALRAAVAAITGIGEALVLVDDAVRGSPWEQDLYRMGVPRHIEVVFASVAEALRRLPEWEADRRTGIVLAGDIATLAALGANSHRIKRINVGGIHHRTGRRERLRYVYLTDAEAAQLRELAARGIEITAQDVPTARPVPVAEFT